MRYNGGMSEIRCSLVMKPVSEANIKWPEDEKWFAWDPKIGIESLQGPEEVLSTLRAAWKYLRDVPRGTGLINNHSCPLIAKWGGDPWHNVDDMRYMLAHEAWSSPELGGYPEGEYAPPEEVPMHRPRPEEPIHTSDAAHAVRSITARVGNKKEPVHTRNLAPPNAESRAHGERTVAREGPRANYGSSHTRETHRPKGREQGNR